METKTTVLYSRVDSEKLIVWRRTLNNCLEVLMLASSVRLVVFFIDVLNVDVLKLLMMRLTLTKQLSRSAGAEKFCETDCLLFLELLMLRSS